MYALILHDHEAEDGRRERKLNMRSDGANGPKCAEVGGDAGFSLKTEKHI